MVDANPANARQQVDLMVTSAGLPADALAGVDAAWQCWDGSRWVTTHIVYRGFGDIAGQTIPVNADFQIRVPSIGLELDRGYPMVIPVVGPGIYRIEDEIIIEQGAVPGHVIVEVHEDNESLRLGWCREVAGGDRLHPGPGRGGGLRKRMRPWLGWW
jgi:hypothetical protein